MNKPVSSKSSPPLPEIPPKEPLDRSFGKSSPPLPDIPPKEPLDRSL